MSAAFSPDGKRIVTASWDKTARLWDAETGQQIGAPLVGHDEHVHSAAFSPDGKRIVTASCRQDRAAVGRRDRQASARRSSAIGAVSSAAFSPDGKRIVTASGDKTARLWDAATGQQIGAPLVGHEGAVHSAAFSPDGKRIVTASTTRPRGCGTPRPASKSAHPRRPCTRCE